MSWGSLEEETTFRREQDRISLSGQTVTAREWWQRKTETGSCSCVSSRALVCPEVLHRLIERSTFALFTCSQQKLTVCSRHPGVTIAVNSNPIPDPANTGLSRACENLPVFRRCPSPVTFIAQHHEHPESIRPVGAGQHTPVLRFHTVHPIWIPWKG